MTKPIVIIGSGRAAYTLAREYRKLNNSSPLLILTADDGRFYSRQMLSTAIGQRKPTEHIALADAGEMASQLNAEIRINTEVTGIDPPRRLIYIHHEAIRFEKLVLATGSLPLAPDFSGSAQANIMSVTTLRDFELFRSRLRENSHLLILGGGMAGCEFANDLARSGYHITLAAAGTQLMEGILPPIVANHLRQRLENAGVRTILGPLVTRADTSPGGLTASFSNGQKAEAELALLATGIRPNIELARESGLETGTGIRVNSYLETNFSHIFALGDCAEVEGHVLLYGAPLHQAAKALAQTLSGVPARIHYPAMPVVVRTADCPIVIQQPVHTREGSWHTEEDERGIRALFLHNDRLLGFALTDDRVAEQDDLIQRIPDLL